MALFGGKEKHEGGLMDAIRCDEAEYLIWKWRPKGAEEANSTRKENAIRWGSSLRVKDGEAAVFVYKQKDGAMQDFIEGPFDETIKTANFPVLASIMGLAFGGGTPFQAEVYFINLAGIIQVKFGVPYFDVFDPRLLDFPVPVAVRGTITFRISDYKAFIKLHRLIDFNLETFKLQIRDAVIRYVKGVLIGVPQENGIPLVQIERKLLQVNTIVEEYLRPRLQNDFGVTMSAMDIQAIEVDKESEGYGKLRKLTANITESTIQTQADLNIENMQNMQRLNTENMEETLRIQRQEGQYAQHMQTDLGGFALHQLKQQEEIAKAAAGAMGQMGQGAAVNLGNGGGGFNPGAMMAGMAMGGAVGQGMAGMMGNVFQGMNQGGMPGVPGAPPSVPGAPAQGGPPPLPQAVQFNVAVNGQSAGPFDLNALAGMVQAGQLTPQSQVWKQGMAAWAAAGTVPELAGFFAPPAPPPPPLPST
ncbi:MAG: SPFH domain-containing protein [Spirochaetales bacterium]|jgi:membrane protease subunit (stomatin/prohibitin family)|nr:SPFH domain-containing protein [Spirochaetales bacterium]